METFELNTDILPCTCVATYGTVLDSTEMDFACNEGEEEQLDLDWDLYKKCIFERASEFVNDDVLPVLQKYGVNSIKCLDIQSPKFYNYYNDTMRMEIEMNDGWRDIMHEKLSVWKKDSKFQRYIEEHWTSCSGFVSFMPENFEQIEGVRKPPCFLHPDAEQCLAAYLTFCLLAEDKLGECEESIYTIYEYCVEHSYEFMLPVEASA